MQAFYLPWAMLALDVIFGSPLLPNFLGIIAGHLYYFLTVLHPLAGGRNILATPRWVYPCLYSLFPRCFRQLNAHVALFLLPFSFCFTFAREAHI